ncbi:DUF4382 domain-containing protein [Vibrio algivorus]|uniref:DUF4382 domain-containing protein n=1 Tax=Vibrio algivorus TaxID=1667024 RepID=A0ABQ6EJZ4_9VIBR|nr:DUF4382 domain-containing protein [Vibrio algivorus]GLT13129.1 hypothetical protein GCM10007931_01030 [Vibrio algivorus]
MKYLAAVAAASALILSGCGGSDSSDNSTQKTANVSFAISDAPVDDAQSVTIAFTQVELIRQNGERIMLDVEPESPGVDYQQLDLLDYQGADSELIITEKPIPVGEYKNLILHISSESNVNFVVDNNGTQPLKQPSNKLQLGGFTVTEDATQAFTIEFDLRKSLVLRGNSNNNNGYILKPHGVSIIDNESAATLNGAITTITDTCLATEDNFVYLYQGSGLDSAKLGDLYDEGDEEFSSTVPEGTIAPYATTKLDDAGTYEFGFLPSGDYTLALYCAGEEDNSIQFDGLTIPQPTGQVKETTLVEGETTTVDF